MMNSGSDWMTYGQRGCLTGAITPLWATPAGLMGNHPCPQTRRTVFWSLERWDASRGCNVDVQDVPLILKHVHMDTFYPERPIFLYKSPRKIKESRSSFLVEFLQAYIFFVEHMYLNRIHYKMKLFFYEHLMGKTTATIAFHDVSCFAEWELGRSNVRWETRFYLHEAKCHGTHRRWIGCGCRLQSCEWGQRQLFKFITPQINLGYPFSGKSTL